ncbi:protein FAM185A-like [Penaeus monodon]|uniref:protein FAM185A-like n=1 Tax=Penaeus monodon TaxID=6687 RepID=UPI0018A7520C|nr:protein FAM185A-like [Penaeus monodon]
MNSLNRTVGRLMGINRNLKRYERLAQKLYSPVSACDRPTIRECRPINPHVPVLSKFFSTRVKEEHVKLGSLEYNVHPGFGTVRAIGEGVDYVIKPANPQEFPDADRAFVSIYGVSNSSLDTVRVELLGEKKDTLAVSSSPGSSRLYCEIEVPIKYDISANLQSDACLQIMGMEADEVDITTEDGEVATRGLKSHNIHIKTQHGNFTAEGTLQGNISIVAKATNLKAKRLQGLKMNIVAEELNTNVQSSYMNEGQITAQRGDIVINHLHGSTSLTLKQGKLSLSGLHGHLTGSVGSGKVDVQVTEITEDSSLILQEGSMVVSVLDEPRHNLHVTAPSLDISKEISSDAAASTTSTSLKLQARDGARANTFSAEVAEGSAKVQRQDWFATLGIKIGN